MSKRMLFRAGVVIVVAFFAVPMVFGQILNPRVTISGGDSDLMAKRTFVVNGQTFNMQYADGARVKARLTLDLTSHFSVEGVYGFGDSNLKVANTGNTPQTNAFGIKGHEVQFNILDYFTGSGSPLRPFLTTGVGDAYFNPTNAAKMQAANNFIGSPAQISGTNKISLTVGGGLELRSRHRLGLRLDVTDHISAVPNFGLPQSAPQQGGAYYPVTGIVHNIQAEAGLVFYLWRE